MKNSFKRNTYYILFMKLSCIVPTLNEEVNVKKFLERYLTQTKKFHELIFVDGNSKDKTREIIQEYIENNPEIKLVICEKKGLPAARNCGLDNSTGDYITTFDADWSFLNEKALEKIYFEINNKDPVYVIGVRNKIKSNYKGIRKYIYLKDKNVGFRIIKKELCPRWDEELGFGEDRQFVKKLNELYNYEKQKKIIKEDNEVNISRAQGEMNLEKIIRRYMWYGRTIPKYLKKTKDWKYAIGYIVYIISIIPIFWFIPFLRGFIKGLKELEYGLDVPFGLGIIEILTAIGTSLGFMQWLMGIKNIGRDIQ